MASRHLLRRFPTGTKIAVAFTVLATLASVLAPNPQDPQDSTAPFPRKGKYVGKETCKECHEDEWDAISEGHHGTVVHGDGFVGCETCHGPGHAHAEDGDNDPALITIPSGLSATEQPRVCGQCHRDQIEEHGGDPRGFVVAGKGCTACHMVHEEIPETPQPGVVFARRADTLAPAAPVGAGKCVTCHPIRDTLLNNSHHASLGSHARDDGCEVCHGLGSLHVETGGVARLITRPDGAGDGVDTCRSCHQEVHPTEFHWRGKSNPMLSAGMTCTTCHTVHEPVAQRRQQPGDGIDPHTGQALTAGTAATNRLCVSCHAPAFDLMRGTIHQSLGTLDTPLSIGCGACHEGSVSHATSGGRAELVESMRGTDAHYQTQACGTCHDRDATMRHHRNGAHFRNEVTCLSCHSPAHSPDAAIGRVRENAERKCASCHANVSAEFRLPNHHPVHEGRMGCSDCHNPHSARPKLHDRELRTQTCVKCHSQYRGPFVFAHQASRLDGCVTCHTPHGASNRRMLRQATTQQNCLQCHADYPAFHDQTKGAVFTNCLNCHSEVHGSNHSRYLFR